jgi:sugar phosphate permease
MFFSFPSAYLIVRLPTGKYLATVVVIWGAILMSAAGCTSFSGLMAQRFFLGAAEAAVAPGFTLVTGQFYTRKEQPIRQGGWFLGNCIAFLLGGLIAYGVGRIENPSLPHWKLLFLIEGTITTAYGIFMYFMLPDSVNKAWFLKPEEKKIAMARVLKDKAALLDDNIFQWAQVWDACKDPQVWCLVLYTFAVDLPNGALTTVSLLIHLFRQRDMANVADHNYSSNPSSSMASASTSSHPSSSRCRPAAARFSFSLSLPGWPLTCATLVSSS